MMEMKIVKYIERDEGKWRWNDMVSNILMKVVIVMKWRKWKKMTMTKKKRKWWRRYNDN